MWASSQEVPIGEIDSAEGCSIPERISHGGCLVVVSVEFGRSMMSVGESPAPRQKNRWSSGLPRSSESPPIPRRICPSTALQWTASGQAISPGHGEMSTPKSANRRRAFPSTTPDGEKSVQQLR